MASEITVCIISPLGLSELQKELKDSVRKRCEDFLSADGWLPDDWKEKAKAVKAQAQKDLKKLLKSLDPQLQQGAANLLVTGKIQDLFFEGGIVGCNET